MRKIVVTGYNGFIGSHLINSLSIKYNIIGISNKLKTNLSIIQIKKDIRKITIADIPKNIDYIIHLAAITDVEYCKKNPEECFDVNVMGTQNMLDISRKINSKFLYLSTSHVYGKPLRLPIDENHPRNPTSIYSASKLAAEIICEAYSKSYGMDLSIIRLFSIYGFGSPTHLVTSKLVSQMMTKKSILLGNLYPKRDFVYISDAINAIELVMRNFKGFQIFNVGSGKSYSILQMYEILKQITGMQIPIKSTKLYSRKNDIENIIADSSKIKQLGWKPRISLYQGLENLTSSFAKEN